MIGVKIMVAVFLLVMAPIIAFMTIAILAYLTPIYQSSRAVGMFYGGVVLLAPLSALCMWFWLFCITFILN